MIIFSVNNSSISNKLSIQLISFFYIICIIKIVLYILKYMKNKVGEYRYKHNMSIAELAERSGMSTTAISNLENEYTSDILLSNAVSSITCITSGFVLNYFVLSD